MSVESACKCHATLEVVDNYKIKEYLQSHPSRALGVLPSTKVNSADEILQPKSYTLKEKVRVSENVHETRKSLENTKHALPE